MPKLVSNEVLNCRHVSPRFSNKHWQRKQSLHWCVLPAVPSFRSALMVQNCYLEKANGFIKKVKRQCVITAAQQCVNWVQVTTTEGDELSSHEWNLMFIKFGSVWDHSLFLPRLLSVPPVFQIAESSNAFLNRMLNRDTITRITYKSKCKTNRLARFIYLLRMVPFPVLSRFTHLSQLSITSRTIKCCKDRSLRLWQGMWQQFALAEHHTNFKVPSTFAVMLMKFIVPQWMSSLCPEPAC